MSLTGHLTSFWITKTEVLHQKNNLLSVGIITALVGMKALGL